MTLKAYRAVPVSFLQKGETERALFIEKYPPRLNEGVLFIAKYPLRKVIKGVFQWKYHPLAIVSKNEVLSLRRNLSV
jgi:hypothetical protein